MVAAENANDGRAAGVTLVETMGELRSALSAAEARKAQASLERERLGTESHTDNVGIVAPHLEGTIQQRRDFAERVPPENLVNCTVNVEGFGVGRIISFKKGAFLGMGASAHRIEFGQRDADGACGSPAHLRIRNVVLSRHGNGRAPFVIDSMPGEHSFPGASAGGGDSAGGLFGCSPVRRGRGEGWQANTNTGGNQES